MPDREKVIKAIETHLSTDISVGCDDCTYENDGWCTTRVLADALALLKDQEEPKHIIRKQCKKEWEDGSIEYFAEWYCPHCNSLIVRGFDNPSIKFCYKCGKPILWEGR